MLLIFVSVSASLPSSVMSIIMMHKVPFVLNIADNSRLSARKLYKTQSWWQFLWQIFPLKINNPTIRNEAQLRDPPEIFLFNSNCKSQQSHKNSPALFIKLSISLGNIFQGNFYFKVLTWFGTSFFEESIPKSSNDDRIKLRQIKLGGGGWRELSRREWFGA